MISGQERERVAALRDLDLLDSPPQERFDRVVRLAQRLFDVPMAAVNLIDEDRAFTLAGVGLPWGSTPCDDVFCARTVQSPDALVVRDASADERFRDLPVVAGADHVRFYAGEPLTAPGGQRVGTLCLLDDHPRDLDAAERDLLRDLADWVEKELATDTELLQAQQVQRRLLPRRGVDLPGLSVAGRCLPSREVGGDFYTWQVVDGRLQVVVGDVMGKGIAAALIAAGVRAVLRGTSRFNPLAEAVTRTGASMQDDLDETGAFVTLLAARVDPATGELEYVDAGHGLAAVIDPDGTARRLSSGALPLGALAGDEWSSGEDRLDPGATLLVVSDGVLEAFSDLPDLLAGLTELARAEDDVHRLVERIVAVGADRAGDDDATALAVRRSRP